MLPRVDEGRGIQCARGEAMKRQREPIRLCEWCGERPALTADGACVVCDRLMGGGPVKGYGDADPDDEKTDARP
jgi:hypothetical protein